MAIVTINGQQLSEEKLDVIIAALDHWDGWDPARHRQDVVDEDVEQRVWDDRRDLLTELRDKTPQGILVNGVPLNLGA